MAVAPRLLLIAVAGGVLHGQRAKAARATSADSPACCGASGALDAAAVRAARLMPREVRARGGTGGADGAAGRDRAAAPQHMVGDLHTRTDVLWWCALHCKIPTLQWVGVYIGLDEQYQCTGFRARGLTEECGELGRAASGAPVLSLYMNHHQ